MQKHGTGDKYSPKDPMADGLASRESVDHKKPLRGDTGEATQRPTGKTETVKSDRGTFRSRC